MKNVKKPVILVSTGRSDHPMSTRRTVSELYGDALRRAGLLSAAMLGGDAGQLAAQFDGLLLSGGGDLSPLLFAQEPNPRAGKPDRRRDQEELGLCAAFCAQRKPILGICRGIQVLNVYFGGDLIQHMDGHDGTCHSVQIMPDSALSHLCGETCMVNSYHHQAIGRLGAGLRTTARAADGTIEAVEHDTLPILGVQWHPERMVRGLCMDTDADHTALFAWLQSQVKKEGP